MLHTDSEYVRNGITRWHTGWVRRNWRNAAGDPVTNMDLWQRLLAAAAPHEIEWRWVRGHAGRPDERAGGRAGDRGAGRVGVGTKVRALPPACAGAGLKPTKGALPPWTPTKGGAFGRSV